MIYKTIKKLPIGVETTWNKEVRGAFHDSPDCHHGANAIVFKKEKLADYFPEIVEKYANLPITVKINFRDYQGYKFSFDRYIIKNIAWLEGFGARVYEAIGVEDTDGNIYKAHVMEYIDDTYPDLDAAHNLWDKYNQILAKYYAELTEFDGWPANFRGEKLIDFDEANFTDKEKYYQDLEKRYSKIAFWGNNSRAYQDIPLIGIEGCRSHDRYKLLGMDSLDLTGKTVLDIGCSGGQVLYWAHQHQAKRIVGVDTPEIARVTFEMANFHQYFNIETIGFDLTQDNLQEVIKKQTGISQFDIVTIFSMNQHIGFHQYMKDLCKNTLYLETNAGQMPEVEVIEYPKEFGKMGYNSFDYKGQVNESGGRSLFICQ